MDGFILMESKLNEKLYRSRQDSNLRGQSPIDFESIALTTRPRMLLINLVKFIHIYNYSKFLIDYWIIHIRETKWMWNSKRRSCWIQINKYQRPLFRLVFLIIVNFNFSGRNFVCQTAYDCLSSVMIKYLHKYIFWNTDYGHPMKA